LKNLEKYNFTIDRKSRNSLNNHNSFVLWFTGLSGSGKSTISNGLEVKLNDNNIRTLILDGDNIRSGLNKDLDFSDLSRSENIRRVAEVSKLLMDAGTVVLASFISPFEKDRELVKKIIGRSNYIEIFVNTSLDICKKRDVKGLYAKSKAGLIKNMTGLDSNYEHPSSPDITIEESFTIDESVELIFKLIKSKLKINNE
jgi:adenylylsulfate kinase